MLISDLNYLEEVVDNSDVIRGGKVLAGVSTTTAIGIATEGENLRVNAYSYGSGDLGYQYSYRYGFDRRKPSINVDSSGGVSVYPYYW